MYMVCCVCVAGCRCKRANDRVSEAKYPVLSREGAGGSPVVLGRIKRFKSLQPKPLEVEIARSLGEHAVGHTHTHTHVRIQLLVILQFD